MPITRIETSTPNGHISRVVSAVAEYLNKDGSLVIGGGRSGGGGGSRLRFVTSTEEDFNQGTYQNSVFQQGALRLTTLPSGNNVAQGKQISYSPNLIPEGAYKDPKVITDGNTASNSYFGATSSGGPIYVQVDLGNVYQAAQIKTWHYYSDGRTYYNTKLEVSEDGDHWTAVFDSAVSGTYKETAEGLTVRFPLTPVRYVRDWLNGSTANPFSHWVELQVYPGEYVSTGYYESPVLDLFSVGTVESAVIELDAEIPAGTSVKIETRLSTDGGRTWGEWVEVQPGQQIPNLPPGTNVLFGRLQYRLTLHGTPDLTPTVKSVAVDVIGQGTSEALQSMFDETRLAILKTNFKLDSVSTAAKYNMPNMVVDLFNDLSGIDNDLSFGIAVENAAVVRSLINLVLHKPYTLSKDPSTQYPDDSGTQLTDGQIATGRYPDPAWVGWDSIQEFSITFDLGQTYEFNSVRVHVGAGEGGLRYPDYIEVFVSDDGVDWDSRGRGDFTALIEPPNTSTERRWLTVPLSLNSMGRYIRLDITTGRQWTFISEVEVIGTIGDSVLVSTAEELDAVPSRLLFSAEEQLNNGAITYYASRDGGTTWLEISKDQVIELDELPTGTSLRIKAVITGDAKLLAWGWAWDYKT